MNIFKRLKLFIDLRIYKRVPIYLVLIYAREHISNHTCTFCCTALRFAICNYLHIIIYKPILGKLIPNFNALYLKCKDTYEGIPWWPSDDRVSRIKALDRLIKEYKKSGEYIYKKDVIKFHESYKG